MVDLGRGTLEGLHPIGKCVDIGIECCDVDSECHDIGGDRPVRKLALKTCNFAISHLKYSVYWYKSI